jgi:hypothetical protein
LVRNCTNLEEPIKNQEVNRPGAAWNLLSPTGFVVRSFLKVCSFG